MPLSRRPLSNATIPCAPSCAMVTTVRATRQEAGTATTTSAASPVSAIVAVVGYGLQRRRPGPRRG